MARRIAHVSQDYAVSVNGMLHTFKTKQAAQAYVRQYVREQTRLMKAEYLRQVAEAEEESFGPGNPGDYGGST